MSDDSKQQLNTRLKELALSAQGYPQASKQRREALTRLINAIWTSGKLSYPANDKYRLHYQDICDEAVQNLFFYICQGDNIEKYNPERGEVMTWVNILLNRRFFPEAIPKVVGKERETNLDRDYMENIPSSESKEYKSLYEQVIECIEEDSKRVFVKEFIRGHPEANFQAIAKRRYSGMSWKEISAEWGIGISSLHLFFQRCMKKFAPILRECI
ncbi:MAG: sigma-70 family RNA polymerase sigma factor [Nostocaceae cyanobacterium]|nr:sigma-70 family RNA polymerase sigma factor [Nostocaceae cyanobacterium]